MSRRGSDASTVTQRRSPTIGNAGGTPETSVRSTRISLRVNASSSASRATSNNSTNPVSPLPKDALRRGHKRKDVSVDSSQGPAPDVAQVLAEHYARAGKRARRTSRSAGGTELESGAETPAVSPAAAARGLTLGSLATPTDDTTTPAIIAPKPVKKRSPAASKRSIASRKGKLSHAALTAAAVAAAVAPVAPMTLTPSPTPSPPLVVAATTSASPSSAPSSLTLSLPFIFHMLSTSELLQVSCVCQRWYVVAQSPVVWNSQSRVVVDPDQLSSVLSNPVLRNTKRLVLGKINTAPAKRVTRDAHLAKNLLKLPQLQSLTIAQLELDNLYALMPEFAHLGKKLIELNIACDSSLKRSQENRRSVQAKWKEEDEAKMATAQLQEQQQQQPAMSDDIPPLFPPTIVATFSNPSRRLPSLYNFVSLLSLLPHLGILVWNPLDDSDFLQPNVLLKQLHTIRINHPLRRIERERERERTDPLLSPTASPFASASERDDDDEENVDIHPRAITSHAMKDSDEEEEDDDDKEGEDGIYAAHHRHHHKKHRSAVYVHDFGFNTPSEPPAPADKTTAQISFLRALPSLTSIDWPGWSVATLKALVAPLPVMTFPPTSADSLSLQKSYSAEVTSSNAPLNGAAAASALSRSGSMHSHSHNSHSAHSHSHHHHHHHHHSNGHGGGHSHHHHHHHHQHRSPSLARNSAEASPHSPARRLLPPQILHMNLSDETLCDAHLHCLSHLQSLTSLSLQLSPTGFTDAGLQSLCSLELLQTLELKGAALSTVTPACATTISPPQSASASLQLNSPPNGGVQHAETTVVTPSGTAMQVSAAVSTTGPPTTSATMPPPSVDIVVTVSQPVAATASPNVDDSQELRPAPVSATPSAVTSVVLDVSVKNNNNNGAATSSVSDNNMDDNGPPPRGDLMRKEASLISMKSARRSAVRSNSRQSVLRENQAARQAMQDVEAAAASSSTANGTSTSVVIAVPASSTVPGEGTLSKPPLHPFHALEVVRLASLCSLKHLTLDSIDFGRECLHIIFHSLSHLTTLSLHRMPINNLHPLVCLTRLQHLSLFQCGCVRERTLLKTLSHLNRLETVSIRRCVGVSESVVNTMRKDMKAQRAAQRNTAQNQQTSTHTHTHGSSIRNSPLPWAAAHQATDAKRAISPALKHSSSSSPHSHSHALPAPNNNPSEVSASGSPRSRSPSCAAAPPLPKSSCRWPFLMHVSYQPATHRDHSVKEELLNMIQSADSSCGEDEDDGCSSSASNE